jgi:hypothetical protein
MVVVSSCVFLVSPRTLSAAGYIFWRVRKVSQNFGEKRADWQLAAHDPRQEKWANLPAVRRGAMCVCVCVGCSTRMEHGLSTPNTQAAFLHSLTAQYLIPPSRGLCESDAGPKCCVVQHTVQNISGLDLTLSVIYCVARDQGFTRTNCPFPIRLYHDAVTAITTEKIRN